MLASPFATSSPRTPLKGLLCEWEAARPLGAVPAVEPRPVGGRPSCSEALQLRDELLAGGNCGGDIGVSLSLPATGIGADRHASRRWRSFSRGFSAAAAARSVAMPPSSDAAPRGNPV